MAALETSRRLVASDQASSSSVPSMCERAASFPMRWQQVGGARVTLYRLAIVTTCCYGCGAEAAERSSVPLPLPSERVIGVPSARHHERALLRRVSDSDGSDNSHLGVQSVDVLPSGPVSADLDHSVAPKLTQNNSSISDRRVELAGRGILDSSQATASVKGVPQQHVQFQTPPSALLQIATAELPAPLKRGLNKCKVPRHYDKVFGGERWGTSDAFCADGRNFLMHEESCFTGCPNMFTVPSPMQFTCACNQVAKVCQLMPLDVDGSPMPSLGSFPGIRCQYSFWRMAVPALTANVIILILVYLCSGGK